MGKTVAKVPFTAEEEAFLRQQGLLIKAQLEAQCRPTRQVFEAIRQIAEYLHRYRHKEFAPRITCRRGAAGTVLLFCEPPCGSNTVLLLKDRLLFVDAGFPCYHEALFSALRPFIEDFDTIPKDLLLTHADVDHCGRMDVYDRVFLNRACADNFAAERRGHPSLREEVTEHAPYVRISKLLSRYRPPTGENFHIIGERNNNDLLTFIGQVEWEGLCFEVYQGAGGHVVGETVYIEPRERLVFSGDIYINTKEQTRRQREYNRIAPALLSSVDTDPVLAGREREALFALLPSGKWTVFGGHGAVMDICI